VTAALYARERTGEGQHIRLSMLDTMISYLWPEAMTQYTVVGREATTPDPRHGPRSSSRLRMATSPWVRSPIPSGGAFAPPRGDRASPRDPRFNTPAGRTVNATERMLLMAEIIKARPTTEWPQRLDAHDVPSAPVLRRSEVIANEQVVARELIAEFDHPDIGRVRQPKPAARFDRTPAAIRGPVTRIGEHSAAILTELGLEAAGIERLAAQRIVRLVKTRPCRLRSRRPGENALAELLQYWE
jgi:crotonobetainyl-CoA:carnitine CoA-transferase CaiB-like acyl-CoA transferase